MKGKTTILTKRVIAGCLLALFVCIHVVKFFHSHKDGPSSGKHIPAGKTTIQSANDCAICDYHFIKDADAVTAFTMAQPPLLYLSVSFFYSFRFTTSVGLPVADRGPPALV